MSENTKMTRRRFLQTTGTAAAAVSATGPMILNASDKAGRRRARVGEGEFTYECYHNWGEVPGHIRWRDTHGVAVDAEGLIYIKHRAPRDAEMDTIAVFDAGGRFVRSFGKEFAGNGHGIDIRDDDGEEFLYVSNTGLGTVAKLTRRGETVWTIGRPDVPEAYQDPKARYSPTNLCFSPDGGFYVGDGYGSHYIHKYDRKGEYQFAWGGFGAEPGKMKTPHGMWLDDRPGRIRHNSSAYWKEAITRYNRTRAGAPLEVSYSEPEIVIADRANARLQYFDLKGNHIGFVEGLSFPADIDTQGDIMLVPDLHARITLFDRENRVITHLGYAEDWTKKALANRFEMRGKPEMWEDGRFIHPHDACFDHAGNILVTEWVASGRVSFLKRVG